MGWEQTAVLCQATANSSRSPYISCEPSDKGTTLFDLPWLLTCRFSHGGRPLWMVRRVSGLGADRAYWDLRYEHGQLRARVPV